MENCVTIIINVLRINLKKNAEHGHLSIVARVQIIVFSILCYYFEMVVHGTGAWYIFFASLALNLWKKCVTNIINMLVIILKKL